MSAAHRPLGRPGRVETASARTRLTARSASRHHPGRRALEQVQLGRPAAGSRARTGSPRRRCRSPRPARRRGRGRGPSGPSGTSCPRSSRGRGCRAASARSARRSPPTRTSARELAARTVSMRQRRASSSHAAPRHLEPEADVRASRRARRRQRRRYVADLTLQRIGAASSRGSARRRTSRGARGRRTGSPG